MIRRRNLRTRNIKTLILDEADEMLNQVENALSVRLANIIILVCNVCVMVFQCAIGQQTSCYT